MIISRTPYRISFFGGGTDYPDWYMNNGGKVLSTTFDKYCYISVRHLPQFFKHKHRIVYSQIESVNNYDEIEHPSAREVLKYFNLSKGLEIHHDGDLPARSGLGSSSSFTAGLVNCILALSGKRVSDEDLAKFVVNMEQNIIHEPVGSQDQIAAVYGGFNEINFFEDGEFLVKRQIYKPGRLEELNNHLMLFFTGLSRFSTDISASKIKNITENKSDTFLSEMSDMVDIAIDIMGDPKKPIIDFGRLLDEAWHCKKSLSQKISNQLIDDVYSKAKKNGAIGGKVLGAGGGGFILFFVEPENHQKVQSALKDFMSVPFKFENTGSRIVLYQPEGF